MVTAGVAPNTECGDNMIVLACYNVKGGVGKTSAAVNLAYLASQNGYRTLLWDLDPQGAATFYLRSEPSSALALETLLDKQRGIETLVRATDYPRLDVLPASLDYRHLDLTLAEFKKPTRRLAKLVTPIAAAYDVLFLDCAPSLSMTAENVFALADWVLVPMIPTTLSVRAYEQLVNYWRGENASRERLLPFFSMVDRRRQMHCTIVSEFAVTHPEVLRSYIPYTSLVERMGEHRSPLMAFAAASPGARAFAALWNNLCERIAIPPSH